MVFIYRRQFGFITKVPEKKIIKEPIKTLSRRMNIHDLRINDAIPSTVLLLPKQDTTNHEMPQSLLHMLQLKLLTISAFLGRTFVF